MASSRAIKRTRADDRIENFWDMNQSDAGTYLTVKLRHGKTLKGRGWPYIQQCVRGILGDQKLQKASFQGDGSLLVKTASDKQTEKLLKATVFGAEACDIQRDDRLNKSRGTIHAFDLIELTEDEVVGWLKDFGVVAAKRFTRRVDGFTENTPTILLTFNKPTCPNKLELDYVTYHVRRHVPNPLICHKCGHFGHAEARCSAEAVCLNCAGACHEGQCQPKCVNCGQIGHSCRSRECLMWKKEREICELKVDRDVSYAHARRIYAEAHQPPTVRPYASVVRGQGDAPGSDTGLRGRVDKMEQKIDKLISLLDKLISQQILPANTSQQPTTVSTTDPPNSPESDLIEVVHSPDPDAHTSEVDMSDTEFGLPESLPSLSSGDIENRGGASQSRTSWVVAGDRKGKQGRRVAKQPSESISSPYIGKHPSGSGERKGDRQMPNLTKEK